MKNLKFIFAVILIATIISGCDYVYPTKQTTTNTVDTATYIRKVLIEDYTGHYCGNCPLAAIAIDTIISLYGSKIVPIAVHAPITPGSWADTVSYGPHYRTNFTTPTGDIWDATFAMSAGGNPCGGVDRIGGPNNFRTPYSTWALSAATELALPVAADIKIANHYNTTTRVITDTIICKYLQAVDSAYSLSVVVTEDSVIDYQHFYLPSAHDDPNYVFNHILRAPMNGTWGDTLSTGHQPAMATFTKIYSLDLNTVYQIKAGKEKHCHVVAFIFNTITKEVIQAEEVWATN